MTNNLGVFEHIDASFKNDKNFILNVISRDSAAWMCIDRKLFGEDNNFRVTAARQSGFIFPGEKNEKIALAAVEENAAAFDSLDSSLANDISFLRRAFDRNYLIYHYLPRKFQVMFAEKYNKIVEKSKWYLDFQVRFDSEEMLNEILHNRRNLGEIDSRPLAIVVFTKSDYNQAFSDNQIQNLVQRGYRVVYFEATTTEEVCKYLLSATIAVKKKADLLVIGGHGTQESITMGYAFEDAVGTWDGKTMINKYNLSRTLNEGAAVVLRSCSAGKGKKKRVNVANFMKKVFPQAKIFAPIKNAGALRYIYDEKGKVIDVIYSCETYAVE